MGPDQQAETRVLELMDRFSVAVLNHDLESLLELFDLENQTEFAAGPMIVGSEASQVAHGEEEIRAYFENTLSQQVRFGFRWSKRIVWVLDSVAWVFADCVVDTFSDAGHYEHPYRITGVFRRKGTDWRWVMCHGSEPAG